MKFTLRKSNLDILLRVVMTFAGVVINAVYAFIAYRLGLPIYMDTIGTMLLSASGGLFSGIVTAVATNVACAIFNKETIYFGFINAFVAIYTAWFIRERSIEKIGNIIKFVAAVGCMSGVLSALVQWLFLGEPQNQTVIASMDAISSATGINKFVSFIFLNTVLSIVDKGISFAIAIAVFNIIPKDIRIRIRNSGWRQKPLSVSDVKDLENLSRGSGKSLRVKMTVMLLACSLALTIIMSWVGIGLYLDNEKMERGQSAEIAARFAAGIIDPYKMNEYFEKGEAASGYKETKDMLYKIRENATGVNHLYVTLVRKDGFYVVMDLETEDSEAYPIGEVMPFDDNIKPYLNQLFVGESIESIETNNAGGWFLTSFCPVLDNNGICRGYVGADVSLDYLNEYMWNFIMRVLLIMSAFFILILASGLWSTGTGMVYPINSIEQSVEDFISAGDDQKRLDESMKRMRAIDIRTEDEIEKVYHIICDMALSLTEKIRSIRRFSEATLNMQAGLIITMADMVESRDSDTGAHVQKTSEYVKIIAEGLQKKGYYSEKVNDKFIAEIVRSAPLHDIGKINISDSILNKHGKLSPEEYEIMKTHTTAGREIIDKAISRVKGESYLREARNMASYHHERWDGKGYPEGLHGEVIPLSARIMAVADVFDALTSARVYKPAFPLEEALAIIREGAGTQFDPKCVEVLLESLPEVKVVLRKYNKSE